MLTQRQGRARDAEGGSRVRGWRECVVPHHQLSRTSDILRNSKPQYLVETYGLTQVSWG